jgi:hypothetical protein
MARIELVDAARLDALRLGSATPDPWATCLAAFLENGLRAYAANVDAGVEALTVDGTLLPLVVNLGNGGPAACSPYSHYVSYSLQEMSKRHPALPPWLLAAAASPAALLLRAARIDRVVSVNNWLLSTSPSLGLSTEQVQELTAFLVHRYPDRAIVLPTVNPRVNGPLIDSLRRSGYRLVRSRRIHMVDAGNGASLLHENVRRDRLLLERTPYEVVSDPRELASQTERIAELYRGVYLDKHSCLNTAFNARFFSLALSSGVQEFRCFRRDNRVDAFVSFFVKDGLMTASLLGYDLKLPRSLGLYRLAVACIYAEAAARGLLLNLSAGAGAFKKLRGSVPVEELEAVYDRHLSLGRRAAWLALETVSHVAAAVVTNGQ